MGANGWSFWVLGVGEMPPPEPLWKGGGDNCTGLRLQKGKVMREKAAIVCCPEWGQGVALPGH